MTTEKLSEDVGKKIVEALKMQSSASTDTSGDNKNRERINISDYAPNENEFIPKKYTDFGFNSNMNYRYQNPQQSFLDNAFQQSLIQNFAQNSMDFPEDLNLPTNVEVLRQLITKLPSGVTRQTGALIIKQTMEALGISMQSVIQDAQQVKETLNNNVKECQANIIEYRKQIGILEHKVQQNQRQAAIMGDIINLFIQTGTR